MAFVSTRYHQSLITSTIAAVDTAYAVARVHKHELLKNSIPAPSPTANQAPFLGYIEGIHIRIDNLAGGSASPKISIRLTCDATGDLSFVPDTVADISLGITTGDSGVAAFKVQLPMREFLGTEDVYLFFKIDQGTCEVTNSCITWSE